MGSLFGHDVRTTLPLRRLRPEPGPLGTIEVLPGRGVLDGDAEITAFDDSLPDAAFALARAGDAVLCACEITGGYRIEPARARIEVEAPGVEQVRWEHRLLATAVPLLLAERGLLTLHAAAVETPAGAVLLAGPSTRGKSTLALALAQLGHPLIAEDGVLVTDGPHRAWPGPTGVRLKEGEGAERRARLVEPPAEASGPVPVAALVVLRPRGAALRVERLDGALAMPELATSLFHHGGTEALRGPFARLARLAGAVPAFGASLPDDLARLDEAAAELVTRVT